MIERWKHHPEHPSIEFSSEGRVRNDTGIVHGRPVGKLGYHGVTVDGTTLYIHREVAKLFVPNPDGLQYVVHDNDDKWDNRDVNLVWKAKRSLHRVNPDSQFGAKLTKEDRQWIKEHYQAGHRLFGQSGLAKKFNVSHQTISNAVNS